MYQAAVDRSAKLENSEIGERVIGYLIVIGLVGIGVVGGFFLFKSCTPKSPSTPEPIDTTTSPPVSTLTLESPFCSPRPSPQSHLWIGFMHLINLTRNFTFMKRARRHTKAKIKGPLRITRRRSDLTADGEITIFLLLTTTEELPMLTAYS